jgi:tetrahydromethanopterin S-methyltransferase subunit C
VPVPIWEIIIIGVMVSIIISSCITRQAKKSFEKQILRMKINILSLETTLKNLKKSYGRVFLFLCIANKTKFTYNEVEKLFKAAQIRTLKQQIILLLEKSRLSKDKTSLNTNFT